MQVIEGKKGIYILEKKQPYKKGKFGGIWLAKREHDELLVSIKKLKLIDNSYTSIANFLTNIKQKNICKTIEYVNIDNRIYLIRKFHDGTDLKTVIKKRSIYKHLNHHFFIQAFIYLLDALGQLHDNHLIHRNIKPSNIIIRHSHKTPPQEWKPENIIITDFEQATFYPITEQVRAPFAMIYSPPEQLLNKTTLLNQTCDLFSASITLLELIARRPPFEDCNAEILLNLQLTYPLTLPRKMDEHLFNILKKAAYKERFPLPPKRLSAQVINEILTKGINSRYQYAYDFKNNLSIYLNNMPKKTKHSFIHQVLSKI